MDVVRRHIGYRRRSAAGLAVVIGIGIVLGCDSETTPPFGASRAAVTGRVTSGGAGLAAVSLTAVVFFEAACTGAAVPVTFDPTNAATGADGRFSLGILANGFSSFDGCIKLTLTRAADGGTLSVTKSPVVFTDTRSGPPVTTQVEIAWP